MENEELEKETRNLIPDDEKAKADYSASDIQVLEGLQFMSLSIKAIQLQLRIMVEVFLLV